MLRDPDDPWHLEEPVEEVFLGCDWDDEPVFEITGVEIDAFDDTP